MNQNASIHFVERHAAEGRADKTAFIEAGSGKTLTYGALDQQSSQIAGALTRAGIRREERAVMLVLDQIEFPPLFWGCLKAGVIAVPLNTLLATDVYRAILADSRASILFVSAALLPVVLPAARVTDSLRKIVVIGEAPDGTEALSEFIADAPAATTVEASADETAFWLYSSGSTGAPKGVRHVHGALQATADTYGAQVLGIRENDVAYSVAKLFFAYGLGNGMTFPMSVGATAVLHPGRPTPDDVNAVIAATQPTIFYGVPTLYAAMVHGYDAGTPKLDAPIRLCVSAGEALPAEVGNGWSRHWKGVEIIDGVGSTEMLHIFLSNAPGEVEYGTSGMPVPGYDVRLVDEAGAEVGANEVGELLVRGASAADGYWNKRDKSRGTFEGEWTRTGDKYERRADGRFVYCGRTDDMFKVSGIWLSPFEVEQALIAHPAVLEAAVVSRRDGDDLEKPLAYVVLKDGGTVPEGLKDFVKDKIGKWKYPRWIEAVEDLPKTATGKIQRFKLRDGA